MLYMSDISSPACSSLMRSTLLSKKNTLCNVLVHIVGHVENCKTTVGQPKFVKSVHFHTRTKKVQYI